MISEGDETITVALRDADGYMGEQRDPGFPRWHVVPVSRSPLHVLSGSIHDCAASVLAPFRVRSDEWMQHRPAALPAPLPK